MYRTAHFAHILLAGWIGTRSDEPDFAVVVETWIWTLLKNVQGSGYELEGLLDFHSCWGQLTLSMHRGNFKN
ncbi:hypothetical protein CGMCC3_g17611 [Colletotrichum fructicola]|nr:uncharacterized protein CGMCC3_g17611 [Colletotrichum fructicola]KAE9566225.1 hypothetical protein CGMCC3_g17611 [Colletotrichum fructicola]